VDTRDFLDLFLSEAREHLDGMTALLGKAAGEGLAAEEVNDLFRHAHSLKGMAASMGFAPITQLSHAMEDLFHGWRDHGASSSPQVLELLQRSADGLAARVDAIARGASPPPPEAGLLEALRAAATGASAPGSPVPSPQPAAPPSAAAPGSDDDLETRPRLILEIALRPGIPLPAARAQVILRHLSRHGALLDCAPPAAAMLGGGFDGRFRVTLGTALGADRLVPEILQLPDVGECRVVSDPAASERRLGERRQETERRGAAEEMPGDAGAPPPESIPTIRVATDRMDRLLDAIGELILERERLRRAISAEPGSPVATLLERLERTVGVLRDEVMTMRLIPFSALVPRLHRTVRDLTRRLGRPVELVVHEAEVALDRSLLEEMVDPLQHILRNNIDHGIEDPEERSAAGKPALGRIEIDLVRHEDRVVLSVQDDGRGIDPAALRRVAVERRFLSREQAERLPDEEALLLITLPGFSTAATTTEISGRGVGMDVVRTQVRRMGGRLTIRSQPGLGTRFEMDLPLTVSVTRAFLCRAAGEVYAVPVSVVQTTLQLRSDRLQGSQDETLVQRGDEVVSVLPLAGVLRADPSQRYPEVFPALLCRVGRRAYALAVDEILGEQEIVIKPLKSPLELLPHYAGAAILDDGRIALILDPGNLTRAARAA
jgi:two-component system, chemotaxis family, sensor kinase CheA